MTTYAYKVHIEQFLLVIENSDLKIILYLSKNVQYIHSLRTFKQLIKICISKTIEESATI